MVHDKYEELSILGSCVLLCWDRRRRPWQKKSGTRTAQVLYRFICFSHVLQSLRMAIIANCRTFPEHPLPSTFYSSQLLPALFVSPSANFPASQLSVRRNEKTKTQRNICNSLHCCCPVTNVSIIIILISTQKRDCYYRSIKKKENPNQTKPSLPHQATTHQNA